MLDQPLPAGVYRHYSGKHYLVIGVARDDGYEEDERLLAAAPTPGSTTAMGVPLCARPLSEFSARRSKPTTAPVPLALHAYRLCRQLGRCRHTEREDPVTREAK